MASQNRSKLFLLRGKQRTAVYAALAKPASGRQILEKVRRGTPSITYQDLRHILRDFEKRRIAVCLNPEDQTGRLYVLVPAANEILISGDQLKLCAQVGRAKTRLAVLEEVARKRYPMQNPLTATEIKRQLRERCPLGLNHVTAALKFLSEHRLVETAGHTETRNMKIYRITDLGITILDHVLDAEKQPSFGNSPTR
jgi:DNA-binding PadR family transcriptional regulator